MSVCENYLAVEEKVKEACRRAGRNRDEVTLIAVSKTKPMSMIEELLPLGVVDFGENKVQELTAKEEALPSGIHWHMIGHLQRNKVKYIVDKACPGSIRWIPCVWQRRSARKRKKRGDCQYSHRSQCGR